MSDTTPPLVAGRYRLDERIGSGPLGEVWRGYDTRADWTVAVKTLGAEAVGATTREALRLHAQAVARVIHPNVAMVLDVGDQEGSPYLVMEFLTGPSLGEEVAARGPMPIVEVCDLVGQAAAGLDAAHRAGVVHGQVNPDSFRLAGSGVLKVVGFGLAGRAGGEGRHQAPEQRDGRGGEAAADLYGLGVVCHELLTGQAPTGAGPRSVRPDVPEELDRLVMSLLDDDPAQRPASGESLRRALAAIARPRAAVVAAPPPVLPVPRAGDTAVFDAAELAAPPADTSNRRLFTQFGVALAAIAAVTVAMIVWAGAGGEEPTAADTPAPSVAELTPGPTAEPSAEPSAGPPSPETTVAPLPTGLRETGAPLPKGTIGAEVPAGGWEVWTSRFDQAVTAQLAGNGIEPRVAAKAQDKIRKAGRKFAEGKEEAGRDEVRHVLRDLRRAQDKGELATSGPLADWLNDWRTG